VLEEKIKSFKKFIKEQKFYKAHEALEEIWFPIRKEKNELSFILKGFINGAVSLELYKRGRKEQSCKIYKVYLKYVTVNRIEKIALKEEFLQLKDFMDKEFQIVLQFCP
jgi:hypothetical protein